MATIVDATPPVVLVVTVVPQRGFHRLTNGTVDAEPVGTPPATPSVALFFV
jgi:hypothetical protein